MSHATGRAARLVFVPGLFALVVLATAADAKSRSRNYTVRVAVDAQGRVTQVEPQGEVPDTVRPLVVRAAEGAQFEPARRAGEPVSSRTHLKVAVAFPAQDDQARVTALLPGGGWQRNGAMPRYPVQALASGLGAQVWARAVFRADGSVDLAASGIERIVVRRSGPRPRSEGQETVEQQFAASVRALLPQWTYLPDEVDGRPVAVTLHVPTRFCAPQRLATCDTDFRRDGEPRAYVPAAVDATIRLAALKPTGG